MATREHGTSVRNKGHKSSKQARKGWLLVVPLTPLYLTWPNEIKKWSDFQHLKLSILHGTHKMKSLMAGITGDYSADIYAINPEGLEWLFETLSTVPLADWPFDKLIVDESTKFKNSQSKRFKLLKKYLPCFPERRLILTGTIVPKNIADLFAQVMILDNGHRLGKFITHFRREYMIDVAPRGADYAIWKPLLDATKRVTEKVADICMALRDTDYLKMPKLIVNDVVLELPKPVRAMYQSIESQFYAELAPGVSITSAAGGAKGMKLRQLCGGSVYHDDLAGNDVGKNRPYEQIHSIKLDRLSDLIDEAAGEPVLIAIAFRSEATAIQAMLKRHHSIDAPFIGGGVSIAERERIQGEWNAGELPVVIAHPTTMALGLNFQAGGHVVVWYGHTYNYDEYDQFNRRVYRQGQTKPVIIHRLLMADTIEVDMLAVLENKAVDQADVYQRLEKRVNGYSKKAG